MHHYLTIPFYTSLILLMIGLIMLAFPSKLGSGIFTIKTRTVLASEQNWKKAQRLHAFLYLILGAASLAYALLGTPTHGFMVVLIFIAIYTNGLFVINKLLEKSK